MDDLKKAVVVLAALAAAREANTPRSELQKLRDAAQVALDAVAGQIGKMISLPRY